MPEITRRSSTLRAPGWFCGRCGSIRAHASSESQNNDPAMQDSIERGHGINQLQQSQDDDWVWSLGVSGFMKLLSGLAAVAGIGADGPMR